MSSGYSSEQIASKKATKARWRKTNSEKVKAQRRAWYVKNREKVQADNERWRKNNPEKSNAQRYNWEKRNPEKRKEIVARYLASGGREKRNAAERARKKLRRLADPNFKLRDICRSRLHKALSRNPKSGKTLELLGCSIEFLRKHLEKQFLPGMTWENHGSVWELDHILPCAEFHLQHSEEQEICFHWTNLQPLLKEENRDKGDKVL